MKAVITNNLAKYFASNLQRKDQQPNIDLAKKLVAGSNASNIALLVKYSNSGLRAEKSDAIKVIYEIAKIKPSLIAPYIEDLIDIVSSNNNRMIWGVLQIINATKEQAAKIIMKNLEVILEASDRSSVIAKDNLMAILVYLNEDENYKKILTPVILQRLSHSAPNQFPTYIELVARTIDDENKAVLKEIIAQRRKSISSKAKLTRLEEALKALS